MGLKKRTQDDAAPADSEQRQSSRDLGGLLAALIEGEPSARRRAARDLGSQPAAAPAMLARLTEEPDHSVRDTLFSSLTQIGTAGVVSGLLPLLSGEDAELRNGAVEALKSLAADSVTATEALLRDPDPDLRLLAIEIARGHDPHHVSGWMGRLLPAEDHVNVIAMALDLLAELGTASDLALLEQLQRRWGDDPFLSFVLDDTVKQLLSEGAR